MIENLLTSIASVDKDIQDVRRRATVGEESLELAREGIECLELDSAMGNKRKGRSQEKRTRQELKCKEYM